MLVSYERRLDWLDELATWFEAIDPASYDVPVPNCPGWNVRNVIAHVGTAGILWATSMTHPRAEAGRAAVRSLVVYPPGRGVEMFPGTIRVFTGMLRSHEPDDPCTYANAFFRGPQCFESWAQHGAAELRLHQLDIEDALGVARSVTEEQALDGLDWSIRVALPAGAALSKESPPPGSLRVTVRGEDPSLSLGQGEEKAVLTGTATDLFSSAWGRGGSVAIGGDRGIVNWWCTATGRIPASEARY
jgi:uncharacterized protein (TIGR03083 family)